MSESTVRSQVRYSEKVDPSDLPTSLVTLVTAKAYFNLADSTLDIPLQMALDIASSVIRGACGRALSLGDYVETFTDVSEPKTERYLVETPVDVLVDPVPTGALVMNSRTGRVLVVAGQTVVLKYTGGYATIPADLMAVLMELTRQQMAFMGHDTLGTAPPVAGMTERAVTVGALRVDFAVNANNMQEKATGGGAISRDALAPYADIVLRYTARRALVST